MTEITVQSGGMELTSNVEGETKESIIEALTPGKEEAPEPKVVGEPETSEESKAGAVLGKKGGEATAAKKAEEAKEAEKVAAKAEEEADKLDLKGRARARVEQVTREAAEMKRQRDSDRREIERLAGEVKELRETKTKDDSEPRDPNAKPLLEDFERHEDWVEALAEWKADQKITQFVQRASQSQRATARDQSISEAKKACWDRIAKSQEADPEIRTKVSDELIHLKATFDLEEDQYGRPIGVTQKNLIADEILRSEKPAEIMVYLTEHDDEYQRIASLGTARDIARAMAKIEDRVEGATAGTTPSNGRQVSKPEPSKAPPPTRPVVGAPHIESAGEPGDDAPLSAHVLAWGQRELRSQSR